MAGDEGPVDIPWPEAVSTARLLDAIGESVIVTDPQGRILFWNAAASVQYGWSAAEVAGRFVFEVVAMAGAEGQASEITAALRAGRGWTGEGPVTRRDGSTVVALLTTTPVFDETGALVATIGVGRDITELRESTQLLTSTQHRFKALIEGSGDLFVITDVEGVIRSLDGPVEAHFGVGSAALVGASLFDLVQPEDLERARARWAAQLASETPLPAEDYWTQRTDGTWLCLNLLSHNLVGDPAIAGMAITARDVTDEKNLERARRATSGANAALIHASTEGSLFDAICGVVVNETMYHLAWIGLSDPSRSLGVRMVAFADRSAAAYVEALEHLAGNETYTGPLVQALKTQQPFVVQDVAALPDATVWRSLALDFGYQAMIALPLRFSATDYGVLAIYSEAANVFTAETVQVLTEMANDLSFGVDALRTRAQRTDYRGRFEASLEATVRAIATATELRDPYTAGHQRRVAQLSTAIATAMGVGADETVGIATAASIHDIGKLLVPAGILSKPGRLSAAEFGIIAQHPEAGQEIVAGIDFPWPVAEMIMQHHERLDGSGYPDHLVGDQILLGARIIAVADVVEAMQSHRPYRPGLGIEAALRQIEHDRGTLLDGDAVDACLHLFREQGFAFNV